MLSCIGVSGNLGQLLLILVAGMAVAVFGKTSMSDCSEVSLLSYTDSTDLLTPSYVSCCDSSQHCGGGTRRSHLRERTSTTTTEEEAREHPSSSTSAIVGPKLCPLSEGAVSITSSGVSITASSRRGRRGGRRRKSGSLPVITTRSWRSMVEPD